jgi:hypothetical protein
MAHIESVRGPVGRLSRFQMEEMIGTARYTTARLRVARQCVPRGPPERHARPARNHVQAVGAVRVRRRRLQTAMPDPLRSGGAEAAHPERSYSRYSPSNRIAVAFASPFPPSRASSIE